MIFIIYTDNQDLSPSLKAFVEFFEIHRDLIAVAALKSDFEDEEDENLGDLIPSLSESERNDFLVRLARGESHLGVQLIHKLRELSNKQEKNFNTNTTRRSLSELRKIVLDEREHRQHQEQKAASLKNIENLEALAKKEAQVWEEVFKLIELKQSKPYDHVIDFFLQLPNTQQQFILMGMTSNKETTLWKKPLENAYSHWHQFYMEAIHQYAPERYLDNLRATISQQWQNGLAVIEDLLAKKEYQESLTAIQETLDSLLKNKQDKNPWTPETSLLYVVVSGFSSRDDRGENEKILLRYYQQTVQGLGQLERANALQIQLIAFESCYDWSTMFNTFAKIPVLKDTSQALFESWRDYLVQCVKPRTYSDFYTKVKTVETWWLHWLLDSIATPEKGTIWIQKKVVQWLTYLPNDKTQLGKEYDFLRLLTKDLSEIHYQAQAPYPKFYQVVIQPQKLSAPDHVSRRSHLQQYAPSDLLDKVIAYWKAQLQNFVPKPEMSQKSDYTEHAEWMLALNELAPQDYKKLLSRWRVEHQRRRNLWKAMENLGLG